jgi:hypothetical protein
MQQPLLLTMSCLNGYYHFPYFNALSEELVKAEGKDAIAAFSPSGLSLNDPAHRYHEALLCRTSLAFIFVTQEPSFPPRRRGFFWCDWPRASKPSASTLRLEGRTDL